jgi:hypothetical protein
MMVLCWLMLAAVLVLQMLLLIGDFREGVTLIPVGALLVAFCLGLISLLRKHAALAVPSKLPVPEAGPVQSGAGCASALSAACRHTLRGPGELTLCSDGSLRFAAAQGPAASLIYFGVDIAATSLCQLMWRRFRAVVRKPFRTDLARQNRDLVLPRDTLRLALAVKRAVGGSSVVIGHHPPAEHLRFEEFLLIEISPADPFALRYPTADARSLVESLGLPDAPPDLRRKALAWRAGLRRRLSLAEWLYATAVVTVLLAPIAAIAVAAMIAEGDAGGALVLVSILAGILALVSLFSLLAQWLLWR